MLMEEIPLIKFGSFAVPPFKNVFTGVRPQVNTNRGEQDPRHPCLELPAGCVAAPVSMLFGPFRAIFVTE